jgi:hypothetical protein
MAAMRKFRFGAKKQVSGARCLAFGGAGHFGSFAQ